MAYTSESIKSLFQNDKYTDMTIKCGDEKYLLHRAVLCTRSSFFEKAFAGAFKEAQTNEIDLSTHDSVHLKAMIRYLYTGEYDDGASAINFDGPCVERGELSGESPHQQEENLQQPRGVGIDQNTIEEEGFWTRILFNVNMWLLGDELFISGLESTATHHIRTHLDSVWNSPNSVAVIKMLWYQTMSAPEEVRDALVRIASSYVSELSRSVESQLYCNMVGIFFDLRARTPGSGVKEHQCPWPKCENMLSDKIACESHRDGVLEDENREEEEEEEYSSDHEFTVDRILAEKRGGHGNRRFYLIKWENYDLDKSTWEPESLISPAIIDAWNERNLQEEQG